ncbi:MAG: FecR domain-containing protein [Elusimicrobia bacterium]|nr:FecR domain-containing protein [Elusimicrobiota bacterium]
MAAVLLSIVLSFSDASAGVTISALTGTAQVRRPNTVSWNEVPTNYVLGAGDELKTDRSSRVTLTFDDGSRVELGPNSSYVLQETKAGESSMTLSFGRLKAWVTKAASRRFSVRTPTAVCSVRGTEFGVDVAQDGRTSVELFTGLLGVQDQKGNEVLLKDGQRVDVDAGGLGKTQGLDEKKETNKEAERQQIKREVGLEMNKEQILAAASEEIKQALYQQGKVMTDVNGNRVRIEEYILRPSPNSFKFVVLNERPDRFDYFFRTGTFNTTLPDDLSTALRQLPGCIGAACTYFLTGYQTAWSNTSDTVLETATGGHQVNLNANADATDNVTKAFDPAVNDFVALPAGTAFFSTLFNVYTLKFNGVQHTGWTNGADITSMADRTFTGTNLALLSSPNCTNLDFCTGNREPGSFHDIVYRQNVGGTIWDKFDNYIIDDKGTVAKHSDFAGLTNGAEYKKRLLDFNYQQIITASEFGGRRIDLVYEPKILMQSGLIP